jgi:hypothetical protein
MLVATNKELYVTLPKRQKQLLSRSIVHAVRSQVPPGRFLQRDTQSDYWSDVGDARATEKTSQALREGAPKLRSKLKKAPGEEEDEEDDDDEDDDGDKEEASRKVPPPGRLPHRGVPSPAAHTVVSPNIMAALVIPPRVASTKAPPPQRVAPPPVMPPPVTRPLDDHLQHQPVPLPPTPLEDGFSFGSTLDALDAPELLDHGFSFGSVMSVDAAPTHHPVQAANTSTNAAHRMSFRSSAVGNSYGVMPSLQANDLSFGTGGGGSLHMSEAEQQHLAANVCEAGVLQPSTIAEHAPPVDYGLEHAGFSTGSMMSTTVESPRAPPGVTFGAKTVVAADTRYDDDEAPQPVDYGLEPAGFSAGSMMSIGTIRLEDTGASFGSVMSFATKGDVPGAVDGGLEEIGASFGSMNVSGMGPPPLRGAEMEAPEPLDEAVPTFLHQQRSQGNLLDCSDTDSEDELQSAQASVQKSAEWEKLKASFENQMQSGAYPTSAEMPPSLYGMRGGGPENSSILPVAATGDSDRQHMPPPGPREDDWRSFEATMLNRGDSLAAEEFNIPRSQGTGGSAGEN